MRVVAGEPAHDAEEFVIAALQRAVARQISEMPFADQRGAIAGAAQQGGQGRKARRHAHFRRLAVAPAQRLDQPDRQPILVAAGDQRDPRVGAQRRIGVGLRKADALGGEPVERRRAVIGLPGAAEIGITAIVDHDEQDVRPSLRHAGDLRKLSPRRMRRNGRHGEAVCAPLSEFAQVRGLLMGRRSGAGRSASRRYCCFTQRLGDDRQFASVLDRGGECAVRLLERCRCRILCLPPISPATSPEATSASVLGRISMQGTIVVAVFIVAALYFGREVLIPITLAFLLTFLLSPLVEWLRRSAAGAGSVGRLGRGSRAGDHRWHRQRDRHPGRAARPGNPGIPSDNREEDRDDPRHDADATQRADRSISHQLFGPPADRPAAKSGTDRRPPTRSRRRPRNRFRSW